LLILKLGIFPWPSTTHKSPLDQQLGLPSAILNHTSIQLLYSIETGLKTLADVSATHRYDWRIVCLAKYRRDTFVA
jgi:hypothetical protein